jgi:UTP--glucose-1-phosphate uridylyltransferase
VPSVSTFPVHDSCPSSLARESSACGVRVELTISDLLLIKSKLYNLEHGVLTMDKSREFGGTPVVKLGDNFKKVANFEKRFKSIPNINELDHLTISGDVWIGKGVRLAGTCILVANEGSKIMIPDGTNLENKLVTGNLNIIDH